jgi:hypothetical protein
MFHDDTPTEIIYTTHHHSALLLSQINEHSTAIKP